MGVGAAQEVDRLRVGEDVGVAVRGQVRHVDRVARPDPHALDLHVLQGDPRQADRVAVGDPAQQFVDGLRADLRLGAQPVGQVGPGQQDVEHLAAVVGDRLAADLEEHRESHPFLQGDLAAAQGGTEQGCDVLALAALAYADQIGEVGAHLLLGLLAGLGAVRGGQDQLGPAVHVLPVGGRDAHQLADDRDGERAQHGRREVGGRAVLEHLVDQFRQHAAGPLAHPLHPARRERGGDTAAQPGVVRRVQEADRATGRDEVRCEPGDLPVHDGLAAEARVVGHHPRVVVAGDQPGPALAVGQLDPGDRALVHQLPQDRVEVRAGQVERGPVPDRGQRFGDRLFAHLTSSRPHGASGPRPSRR